MRTIIRLVHNIPLLISICITSINFSTCFAPPQERLRSCRSICYPHSWITTVSLTRLALTKKLDDGDQRRDSPDDTKKDQKDDNSFLPTTARQLEDRKNQENRPFFDPGLLVVDLLAIALSCQLIGLMDVITDPEFIKAGGWLQPMPKTPSTLAVLFQRISYLSALWVGAVTVTTTTLKASVAKTGDRRNDDGPSLSVETLLQTLVLFAVFRVVVGLALGHPASFLESSDWPGILRDIYVVGLLISALRFLYTQYLF